MKKSIILMTLSCILSVNSYAQVYANDHYIEMPTMDLYNPTLMRMAVQAARETAAQRRAYFERNHNDAIEAYRNKNWNLAIHYVNQALSTHFQNGQLYYIRGYANEQLGYLRDAKKDYKRGRKLGSQEAANALASLRAKRRNH